LTQKPAELTPANVKLVAMSFLDWIYSQKAKPIENMTANEIFEQPASFDDDREDDHQRLDESNNIPF
jgi:hypothetical protein